MYYLFRVALLAVSISGAAITSKNSLQAQLLPSAGHLNPAQVPDSLYLQGHVQTRTGQPLPGVVLTFKRLQLHTTSDAKGNFFFTLPIGRARRVPQDNLLVDYSGCEPVSQPVRLFAAGSISVSMCMETSLSTQAECTLEDIVGQRRARQLRKATRKRAANPAE